MNPLNALEKLKLRNRLEERLEAVGVPYALRYEAIQKMELGGILCVDRTDATTTRLSFIKAKGAQ